MNAPLQQPSGRIHSLDGLRGVAALTVVTTHIFWSLYQPILDGDTIRHGGIADRIAGALAFSPLRVLWSGHEAVILFFVLSGYVLTLPYLKNPQIQYGKFLVKRVCRLYLPYAAAVTAGFIAYRWVPRVHFAALTPSARALLWQNLLTGRLIVQHYLFIGTFRTDIVDGPIWSLVHEMRISLVFPFLVALVLASVWRRQIGIGIGCVIAGVLMSVVGKHMLHFDSSVDLTMTYGLMFVTGMMLAQHRNRISGWYNSLSRPRRRWWFTAGIISYSYASCIAIWSNNSTKFLLPEDWMALAGSVIFIVAALEPGMFQKFLETRVVSFLGRISYSLYLCHVIVLNVLVFLMHQYLSLAVSVWLALPVSIAVSRVFYILIERPSQTLGRRLTRPAAIPVAHPISETAR